MRNSLLLKLMGAFLLVIAIGALVIAWMASRATQNAFNLYSTRNGQAWSLVLAPGLGEYFTGKGSWQGVDQFLQSNISSMATSTMMSSPHGKGTGSGSGQGRGQQAAGTGGMWAMMNQRVIIADPQGRVVYDTAGDLIGNMLSAAQKDIGAAIVANDQPIGTVIVTPSGLTATGSPAEDFLSSVNQSIITAVLIAGAIALGLGALLFIQITAPLRQLTQAADAIAGGNLKQRVIIRSHDEFGELGQSFNQMTESLEKADTLRRHMAADIAHELRTPLAVMQANLEGMMDKVLPLDPEQIGSLHEQTLLLNRLVGDLRLLTLAESGELQLERKLTSLEALIHKVIEHIQPQARQQGVELRLDVQNGLSPVSIDADRITQVLNNIIANALRYTSPGKTITIKAENINQLVKGVQVSVIDPGPGIEAEDLPYVFERFYRVDKSRARASGGSGLGLTIVKQLVEAHGGKVEAASPAFFVDGQKGYGTRITFTLPAGKNSISVLD
jgi:signal transduction histidine kinase